MGLFPINHEYMSSISMIFKGLIPQYYPPVYPHPLILTCRLLTYEVNLLQGGLVAWNEPGTNCLGPANRLASRWGGVDLGGTTIDWGCLGLVPSRIWDIYGTYVFFSRD